MVNESLNVSLGVIKFESVNWRGRFVYFLWCLNLPSALISHRTKWKYISFVLRTRVYTYYICIVSAHNCTMILNAGIQHTDMINESLNVSLGVIKFESVNWRGRFVYFLWCLNLPSALIFCVTHPCVHILYMYSFSS